MAEMDFGGGTRALCALHPGQAAASTCTRCGNFMCDTCSVGGTQALCPGCCERAGVRHTFALRRDTWTVSTLMDACWEAFKREWVMVSVGVLVVIAASFAGQIVSQILSMMGGVVDNIAVTVLFAIVGYIASTVVQGVVSIGFMRMLMDVLNGGKADLMRIFSQLHKTVPYLLTTLLMFALMLPLLLVVVGAGLGTLAATVGLGALDGIDWTALNGPNPSGQVVEDVASLAPGFIAAGLVAVALYIFPGLWLITPLLLVQPELAHTENPTAMGTLRRCFAYARGERLPMVGTVLLGSLAMLAGVFACCVGMIPAAGFFNLMVAGLYLTLRNGADEA
ncbi:hypothetical protein HPC49_18200 [Pyxidicoccus fallax]|uniref:B box-type domain-containing protein n=1 Tax=Pyxidicoccus fallax TaxID=394095 RepID=A0A848LKK3_9BACT|nr:hypothetical protein [Pyxidicoccus fallax]NMO18230.1 hypothetical protein [Pyxidicoccus fallax]NPC80144.1 hypothetical protein [Pyxidicoccus fallax]